MSRVEEVKKVISNHIGSADYGLFFTRNVFGDNMTTVFHSDGVTVDICFPWRCFEVFGLNREERQEVMKHYEKLQRTHRKERR